jgi:transcriptional/translational regulatory protein YebC/TACO1
MAGHSKWAKAKRLKAVVDAGAEDFKSGENGFEILTEPAIFEIVHKKNEAAA